MKLNKSLILSLVSPLMILISLIGLISVKDNKKIYYLPLGCMGIFIVLEKELSRKLNRNNILEKIKTYQKSKLK